MIILVENPWALMVAAAFGGIVSGTVMSLYAAWKRSRSSTEKHK